MANAVDDVVDLALIQKIAAKFPRNAKDFEGKINHLNPKKNPILKTRIDKMPEALRLKRIEKLELLAKKHPNEVKFSEKGFPDFSSCYRERPAREIGKSRD